MIGWLSDCTFSKSTCGANNEDAHDDECVVYGADDNDYCIEQRHSKD